MGYYSEVAIKCGKKAYGMLKETCHKVDLMPDKIFKDGDEYILHWDWIRWDENKDIIKNTFNKLDELQDEQDDDDATGYGYKFIRIGENNNDVETRENDEDIELCIICKIAIPDNLAEINPGGETKDNHFDDVDQYCENTNDDLKNIKTRLIQIFHWKGKRW